MDADQKLFLLTGGTGVLGRCLVQEFLRAKSPIRVLSRRPRPADLNPQVEFVSGDLLQPNSLLPVLSNVYGVIHCASRGAVQPGLDLSATANLIKACQRASIRYLLFVSVAGIDDLQFYPFFRAKKSCESLIETSGLPFGIVRATHFHQLIAYLLKKLTVYPITLAPKGARLQPIDPAALAPAIFQAAAATRQGHLTDHAGPEIVTLAALGKLFPGPRRFKKVIELNLPLPIFRVLSSGKLLPSAPVTLGQTWTSWWQNDYRGGAFYAPR